MTKFQQARHALGSEAILTIVADDQKTADELFKKLWKLIEGFEARFSRFRPDSELSQLNQQAGQPFRASPELRQLLIVCQRYASTTNGLFNPFTLPALQTAGYKGSWPSPELFDADLDVSDREVVNPELLQIDRDNVVIPIYGALDLGGIGKGYLLDILADWLKKQGITNFWLSLGGDIVCSGYDVVGTTDSQPWTVQIADAASGQPVAVARNNNGEQLAVATSGVTKRRGHNWHHLIDPRTGKPADTDLLHVTVVSTTVTAADVYAKVLLLDPNVILPSSENRAVLGMVQQTTTHKVVVTNSGGRLEPYRH